MKVDSGLQSSVYADDDQSGGEDDSDFQSDFADSRGYHGTSKPDMRKSNKPIMEKRRRARINNCLNELKGILLEAMRKDPARHSKLEKADILELTVRHLQNVQRNQLAIAMATDPTVLHRFKNGFTECVTEVSRYLGRLDGVEEGIRGRLTGHLGSCVNGLQQVGPMTFGSPRYSSLAMPFTLPPSPVTPNTHGLHPSAPQPSGADSTGHIVSSVQSSPIGIGGDMNNNNNRFVLSSPSASSTVTSANFEIHRPNVSSRMNLAFNIPPKTAPADPTALPANNNRRPFPTFIDEAPSDLPSHPNEKGTNTVPGPGHRSLAPATHGTPLDFSLASKQQGKGDARGGKVEPMIKSEAASATSGLRDSMWRPW